MGGLHLLKSYAVTQSVIAISSGESEFYAVVKGAACVIGLCSMAKDLGLDMQAELLVDASAGIGIASRRGCGKVRHLDTQYLWIQNYVTTGRLKLSKVQTKENYADLFTKHLPAADIQKFMTMMCCRFEKGKADASLDAA